jgi:type IX secretion system PorP/SprF family membrane protein
MKKSILALSLFLGSQMLSAQQDPLYSQYFNNPMLINPAFAGSNDRLYAGLAYRSQWSGIDGGPTTFNFNGHLSLVNNKIGVGVITMQDKVGDVKNTQYGGTMAYRIKLTHSVFSFGMQAGFTRYATDQDGVNVRNPDPLFTPFSETKFNTGVGLLLKGDRYALGLSVPQLLSQSVSMGGQSIQLYQQTYYLYGSYIFYLNENIELKPSTLLRASSGLPLSMDLNANFTFNRLYTAGLFTRNLNTYGVLLQAIFKDIRAGYVFELPGKGSALNFNTHEISLAISLDVLASHNHSSTGF